MADKTATTYYGIACNDGVCVFSATDSSPEGILIGEFSSVCSKHIFSRKTNNLAYVSAAWFTDVMQTERERKSAWS